ncbi:MAG: hypothetical protein SGILL_008815 [Bacillariaceae sp.]
MDVLLGRPTAQHKKQEGNKAFWDYVVTQLPAFSNVVGDVEGQLELAQKIIDYIEKEKGGRFLLMDGETFTILPEEDARSKVRRGMKEKYEREQKAGKSGPSNEVAMLGRGGTDKPRNERAAKNPPPKEDEPIPTKVVDTGDSRGINPMDVLVGHASRSHKGNVLYWNRIMELLPRFPETIGDKDAQLSLAQEAIDYVEQENGGRFLEADGEGGWTLGDRNVILGKVRRAIKEKWERLDKKGAAPKPKNSSNKRPAGQDVSANRPKRAKGAPVAAKKRPASDDYTVQLTQDIVELLKTEQKPLSMRSIMRRVDAETDDAEGVVRSLVELSFVHKFNEEETRKGVKVIGTKYVWWESAPSYLKQQSWEDMPMSEDAEHTMRSEMSLLVREEAKLDAWISRMRNLRVMPQQRDRKLLYVTANDIHHAVLDDEPAHNDASSPSPKKKKTKKVPTLAVHAPFGTNLQSSTPVSYQKVKPTKTRQVLVSCTDGATTDTGVPPEVQVYFLPKSGGNTQLLQNNPVFQWIKEPAYTSETNGIGGAGDSLHVSCLREDEGVSSFF